MFLFISGVQVRNPVSTLSAFTNVTVVQPMPSDLQVTIHPSQDDIPSCIPVHDGPSSALAATAAVFVQEEVVFQASLGMGINLTFQWSFSDDGASVSRAPYMQPSCEGIACLRDSQVMYLMAIAAWFQYRLIFLSSFIVYQIREWVLMWPLTFSVGITMYAII